MLRTHQIYKFIKTEIDNDLVAPDLLKNTLLACQKALDTKFPMLIHGNSGSGKTFGIQYFAYTNDLDISLINASVVLRKKEGRLSVRSEIMKSNKRIKIVLIDEVEKDTSLNFLINMVKLNQKTSKKTNVIMICVTNHFWKIPKLAAEFKGFTQEIKSPFVKSIGKQLRLKGIKYKGPIIRDLRFFHNILLDPKTSKTPGVSNDAFVAINNYLEGSIEDRDIFDIEPKLNAPLWKWLLMNMHNGTFMYNSVNANGNKQNTYPKTNTAMYNKLSEILSLSSLYGNKQMLNFAVPSNLKKPYIKHPSTLTKKNQRGN